MSDFILHHYPTSPFSEKIRLIFGTKKISWRSTHIPRIMPKPDVIALTGGYRKTPILQVGADIYCDSALIAQRIDADSPSLFPPTQSASAFALSQWADSVLFSVAVRHVFQPANLVHLFGPSPGEMEAFTNDRKAMRVNATTRRFSELEALATMQTFLRNLDRQLQRGVPYVSGATLSIADFSVYHCLWFMRRGPHSATIVEPYANVMAWMAKMAALGHGQITELSSSEAIEIARNATPQSIPNPRAIANMGIGDDVEILPTDYGIDPTPGALMNCSDDEIVIRRVDARAGELHVHFPRLNYEIRKVARP